MRINEYKRVLDGVDDSDLEQLQIRRQGTRLILEYPENPPVSWSHCTGSLTRSKVENSTDRNGSDPTMDRGSELRRRAPVRGGMARQNAPSGDLPACQFLDGFVADMKEAFGERLACDCINACRSEPGKSLTARQVKEIIISAERKLQDRGIPDRNDSADCRENNDKIIAGFFKDRFWTGLLFPDPDANNPIAMPVPGRSLLPENAARLVRNLTTALCQSGPEYGAGLLTRTKLVEAARNVLAIHGYICGHPEASPLARDTAWLLLDHAFKTKGLDHVVKMWPVYMACAVAYGQLALTEGSMVIRQLAHELSQSHDWSSTFLMSVAPFYRDTFLQNIDRIPWAENSPGMNWNELFDTAMALSRVCVKEILSTHLDFLLALSREEGLTEWQRRMIRSGLERTPCSMEYFSQLVDLTGSSVLSLAALAQAREPACVFDSVTRMSTAIVARIPSLRQHDRLLEATLSAAIAGLSPEQARSLLQHVSHFDQTTRQMIARKDVPRTETAYKTLVSQLRQRAMQAGSEFQMVFLELFRRDQARGLAQPPMSGNGTISREFITLILESTIVLNARDGQPIIDLNTLRQFNDDKSRIDHVESSLFKALALVPNRPEQRKYLTLLMETLYRMQDIFMKTCSQTIFKHDASGMLHLSDNTPLQSLDEDLNTCVEVTLIEIADRNLHLGYSNRFSSIRSALDKNGNLLWLDPDRSVFLIEAEFVVSPAGVIGSMNPLSCKSDLVLGQWPQSSPYPQPVLRDLVGEVVDEGVRISANGAMRKDLFSFAQDRNHENARIAMEAMDAIEIFTATPVDEEVDCAVGLYEKFIKTGALDFLGKRNILGDILQELYPRIEPDGVVLALRKFAASVLALPDLDKIASPESRSAIDRILDLSDSALSASIAENRMMFDLLLESLTTPGSRLSPYLDRVPAEELSDLIGRLELFVTPINLFVFLELKNALTDFLGREVLPLFIESVVSRSSDAGSMT